METFEAIVVIALGVALGFIILGLLNAIMDIPAQIRARRKQKEFMEGFRTVVEDVFKDMERVQNEQAKANQSREGSKATSRGRSKTAGSGTKNRSGSSNKNSQVRSGVKSSSKKTGN